MKLAVVSLPGRDELSSSRHCRDDSRDGVSPSGFPDGETITSGAAPLYGRQRVPVAELVGGASVPRRILRCCGTANGPR
jgi:hypothetical protein